VVGTDDEAGGLVYLATIIDRLLQPGTSWTDRHGVRRALTLDDILIVAPYNDQVNRLKDRLPGAKAGTVDKFQDRKRRSSFTR